MGNIVIAFIIALVYFELATDIFTYAYSIPVMNSFINIYDIIYNIDEKYKDNISNFDKLKDNLDDSEFFLGPYYVVIFPCVAYLFSKIMGFKMGSIIGIFIGSILYIVRINILDNKINNIAYNLSVALDEIMSNEKNKDKYGKDIDSNFVDAMNIIKKIRRYKNFSIIAFIIMIGFYIVMN